MHPRRIVKEKSAVLPVSVLDYLCFKNNRSSIHEIRLWMGDNRFLEFLNMFAGSYLVLPSSDDINRLYYDYLSAHTVQKIKEAKKKKDLMEWNRLEGILRKIAKKTGHKYKNVYLRGLSVLKELEKTTQWIKGLRVWQKKYLKQEDDQYEDVSE